MSDMRTLDEVLAEGSQRDRRGSNVGRPAKYSPAVSAARRLESSRRSNGARSMAYRGLAVLHPEEFDRFYVEAKAKLDAECAPLPEVDDDLPYEWAVVGDQL